VIRTGVALILGLMLSGCSSVVPSWLGGAPDETSAEGRTLSTIVAELHLHLRDDTYRFRRARTEGGGNVFALSLWRLDRLRARRNRSVERWENIDIVIEYARARALERMRRYGKARSAYERVASVGSRLDEPAEEGKKVMSRFAEQSRRPDPPPGSPEASLALIDERIRAWQGLALEYSETPFGSLAREEAESWEVVHVDWFARHRPVQEAIDACQRLLERHHASKLYAKHLIRLGDLNAHGAEQIYLRARANLAPFDAERYESFLDHAFAAYELAGDEPRGAVRDEAESKIETLLAQHDGIRADVP
jgi:hypothetical protein